MSRLLRRSGPAWAGLAALTAAALIPLGCGSPPAGEQQAGGAGQEVAQGPEQAPTEESAAVEPAGETEGAPAEPGAAESAPEEVQPEPTAPPAEEEEPSKPAAESPAPVQVAAAAAAVDWVGSAQKWVPIFSLETEGVYLGAAQVAGPGSQVAKVKGVAELRLTFKDIGRIYAYVPVSTISLTKLNRVQGVSVWAIGDLQLAEL